MLANIANGNPILSNNAWQENANTNIASQSSVKIGGGEVYSRLPTFEFGQNFP